MGSDCYAPIKPRKRVTLDDLMARAALYVTGCGGTERQLVDDEEFAVVNLRGSVSDPWRKMPDPPETRWFELRIVAFHAGGRAVKVTTRMADPFTRDVAAAFARRLAMEWGTEVSDG